MKKYLLREIRKQGFEKAEDIFAGCTKGSTNSQTRCIFQNREEALTELRTNEAFNTSCVVNNYFTKGYEVTEFIVVLAEVGEYDNPLEDGTVIAYSDMPDKSDEACWNDNPGGF